MSEQAKLFHDSILDALKTDVSAIGGIKDCAALLWPAENPSTAESRLRNGLNPEHQQKLSPDEVMAIKLLAKKQGSFAAVKYESMALLYSFEWQSPEDKRDELLRNFIQHAQRGQEMYSELMRVVPDLKSNRIA